VHVLKKAKKFCSYDWAKLMQNWPLKLDMQIGLKTRF